MSTGDNVITLSLFLLLGLGVFAARWQGIEPVLALPVVGVVVFLLLPLAFVVGIGLAEAWQKRSRPYREAQDRLEAVFGALLPRLSEDGISHYLQAKREQQLEVAYEGLCLSMVQSEIAVSDEEKRELKAIGQLLGGPKLSGSDERELWPYLERHLFRP